MDTSTGRIERAPDFSEAWARLAYVRAWLHFDLPFAQRPESASTIEAAAERALSLVA